MPDIQLDGQSLTTTSATTSPSAGASETWATTALSSGIPALVAGQSYALVDATSGATAPQQKELIRVTACAGSGATSITVTRGVDGSTPVAHANPSTFNIVTLASWLNNVPIRATTADMNGLLSWTGDPGEAVSSATLVAATMYTCAMKVFRGDVITKFWYWVQTIATTPTDSYWVLYDPSGAIIAGSQTADQSTATTSTGIKQANLGTAYTATATGVYYGAFRYATGSALKLQTTTSGGQYNIGPGNRFGVSSSAWSTAATPPSTLGTLASAGSLPILAGLS